MRHKIWMALAIVFITVSLSEILVRYFGLVDFPIYVIDRKIGFFVKENQNGVFMNRNDWYFNDKNMPIQRNFDKNERPNILLIGNSIIMGGNGFKQKDKLTSRLQNYLAKNLVVWPIAIGGWTQVNEMAYLDRHPEIVAEADNVAWEYMSGGLSRATPWSSEYVFPSHRPVFATWYVLRRYVLPKLLPFFRESELPATGAAETENISDFDDHLDALMKATHRHGAGGGGIWLYPTASQLAEAKNKVEWLPERSKIQKIADKYGLWIIDISTYEQWKSDLYQPDGVHPNVRGNEVLASILYSEIKKHLK